MGISYDQSSKWQKIANIPVEKFENYVVVEMINHLSNKVPTKAPAHAGLFLSLNSKKYHQNEL